MSATIVNENTAYDENGNPITPSPAPKTASAGADSSTGPLTKEVNGYLFQFVPDPLGLSDGSWEKVGLAKDAAGGGAGRNDALTAAQAALSGFLQAQSLADARKAAAMQNFQQLGKFALPPGATTAPGYEPGGLAQTLAARQGLKQYTPPPIQTRTVNPNDTMGDVPPEVMAMISAIRGAGGAG